MANEQYQDKIFDDTKEVAFTNLEPLVNEPYTYENMVNNPIIKPIAELDRSIRDLEDMINKKLIDAKRNQSWINAAIEDVPSYQDSPFIARLISLAKETQDVIKLQDIQLKNYREKVREIFDMVKKNYGVLVDKEKETYVEVETVVPDEGYEGYLQRLIDSKNEQITPIAEMIKDIYEKDIVNTDEKRRYENACSEIYKNEPNKTIREIIAKILRMELLQ